MQKNLDDNLKQFIIKQIKSFGPMRLDMYIYISLMHPKWGFYQKRNPIGDKKTFITSPEISQVFGEILGSWAQDIYNRTFTKAKTFNIIELGPGNGTLISDFLRKIKAPSINIHLVEQSASLRRIQQNVLLDKKSRIHWHESISSCLSKIKDTFIIIANEFLDALPVRQFRQNDDNLLEVFVNYTVEKNLHLVIQNNLIGIIESKDTTGEVKELCPEENRILQDVSRVTREHEGIVILIDYGITKNIKRSTLQGIMSNKPISILHNPGHVDITHLVNFGDLEHNIRNVDHLKSWPVITQSKFLLSLGIQEKTDKLVEIFPDKKNEITDSMIRLSKSKTMGDQFKILSVTSKKIKIPEPFSRGVGT